MRHVPVLLNEVVDSLQLKPGMNVVDCTIGDAGHAEVCLEKIFPNGRLLAIDADPESLLRSKQYLYRFEKRVIFVRDNFENLAKIIVENNFSPVNGIVMDLGWSSPQFEERGRGFSFAKDEPLDMRYAGKSEIRNPKFETNPNDQNSKDELTASVVVNNYDFDDLYRVFRMYGEEDLSREIADAIVEARKVKKIETTKELVDIILNVYRRKLGSDKEVPWIGGVHPATKVFQALRIEVNHEFEALRQALPQAVAGLGSEGRLAVITFHSLEDRIVKHYFQSIEGKGFTIVNKKPIVATQAELDSNPRSRSAKLRVIEKLGN